MRHKKPCRDKLLTSWIELLLTFVMIEGLDVETHFLSSALCFVATIIAMSIHDFSVSLGILLIFCCNIILIVATFLMLFA